ncbi:MAG TPA: TIM barrel protein, partial [Phycisphaeraceae bacterium]
MAILTHGSDLSLSPTLTPMVRRSGGTVQAALARLTRMGFGWVQLDATLAGIRPRELNQRARKDLLALLNRQGIQAGGIDLFIPRRHYLSSQHVDRAVAATIGAIELAADLGRLPLSLALPVQGLADDVRAALVEAADGRGVRLAVHAEDQAEALRSWVESVDLWTLGVAVDPAALLARGQDPAAYVQRWGKRLAVARLSDLEAGGVVGEGDADAAGAVRCAVGQGELDLTSYRVAVDLASG